MACLSLRPKLGLVLYRCLLGKRFEEATKFLANHLFLSPKIPLSIFKEHALIEVFHMPESFLFPHLWSNSVKFSRHYDFVSIKFSTQSGSLLLLQLQLPNALTIPSVYSNSSVNYYCLHCIGVQERYLDCFDHCYPH